MKLWLETSLKMNSQATSKLWKTEAMATDIPYTRAAKQRQNHRKMKLWLETSLKMISQATSKPWKIEAMARDIPYT